LTVVKLFIEEKHHRTTMKIKRKMREREKKRTKPSLIYFNVLEKRREEEKEGEYMKTCLSCLIGPIAQYKHLFNRDGLKLRSKIKKKRKKKKMNIFDIV